MKKMFFLLAALVWMSFGAQAQSAEYKAAVKKLMAVSGGDAVMKMIPEQMLSMIEQQAPNLPASVKSEIKSMFSDEAVAELMDKMAPIYQKYYTEKDLKDMIAFYDTPLGKKMATVQPQLSKESMTVAQKWAADLGQKIAAKMMQSQFSGSGE